MKFYLGVTDNNWFSVPEPNQSRDINFWQPGGSVNFKVLTPGAPFLFKLKSPLNAIGGVGFFSSHTFLPISVAWETFANRNGCDTYFDLKQMIMNYRKDKSDNVSAMNTFPTTAIQILSEKWFITTEK